MLLLAAPVDFLFAQSSLSFEQAHDGATCRRVGVRRGLRALRHMERRRVLLIATQSGRLSSRQINVPFLQCSAVATLAGLPGTAALSCLFDQGIIGSQHMPAYFAAVTTTKHLPTKMIKFCYNDASAAHPACSSQVGSQRVPMRVWCSYVLANPAAGGFPLHRALAKQP